MADPPSLDDSRAQAYRKGVPYSRVAGGWTRGNGFTIIAVRNEPGSTSKDLSKVPAYQSAGG